MDLTGKNLGKYKIIRKLGGGGMGNVFLAQDTILERQVALKLLAPSLVADTSFVERFRQEARALARLDHPSIVRVHDADWLDNQLYLVIEYVEGGSLADIIEEDGALPPDLVLRLLNQVATGLDYAHSLGMIHRDIKPHNILLQPDGRAQITDFGLVKDADTSLTADGQRLGTPSYMAPEQIQGQEMGPAVDIYALGVVAYELLTGRPPFTGTLSAVFEGHLLRPPPPLRQFNPSVPVSVQNAVLTALSKKPEDRPGSATTFVELLERAYQSSDDQDETVEEPDDPAYSPTRSEARPIISPASDPSLASQPVGRPVVQPAVAIPRPSAAPAPAIPQPGSGVSQSGSQTVSKGGGWMSRLGIGAAGLAGIAALGLLCVCGLFFVLGPGAEVFGFATPTPIPTATPLPVELYRENFDVIGGNWTAFRDEDGITDFDQGGYRIRVDLAGWLFWSTAGREFTNMTAEVDTTKLAGPDNNEFGLICRYVDNDNFYSFVISSDGFYGIVRRLFGESEVLTGNGLRSSTAINTGAASNHLRADCDDFTLRLWVNGILVDEVLDANLTSGDVGLIAGGTSDEPGVDILFDDLFVTEPQPAGP
jgi:serine/threonine protein kinase